MYYNLDFLYAALVVCLAMGVHAAIVKENFKGVIPRWILMNILVSAFVAVVDIIDSTFIEYAFRVNIYVLYVSNILLYLSQMTLPLVLYLFCLDILGMTKKDQRVSVIYIPVVVYALVALLVVTTPWTGWVFIFEPDYAHTYVRAWGLYAVYTSAAIIGISVLVLVLQNRRYLRRPDVLVICFDVLIIGAVPVIQTVVPHVCLVGFGAAMGSLALYLTFSDPTGLGDTKTGAFEAAELRRRIAMLLHRGNHFNLTFVTIDNTRALNNAIGLDAVDGVLRLIYQELLVVCKTEQVYKLQGGRFCVLSFDDGETENSGLAIKDRMKKPFIAEGSQVSVDARVMILYSACDIACDVDIELFLDFLLEKTGSSGKSYLDQEELMRDFANFQQTSEALEKALAEDTFEIFLQPLYDVASGEYRSAEVLSRLKGADGRYIPPYRFIELAEDDGTIGQLSRLQFFRLCRFLREHGEELHSNGLRDVKYNVSALEMNTEDQGQIMLDCIRSFGLDPTLFTFEVTESTAYTNSDALSEIMNDLQAAGCRVYMDDFGSGFANMETIFRLPFDGIKLDITLLRLVSQDEKAAAFYHGLVDMIHALGKKVVSEGVETKEEADLLAGWGVDVIQGFYYSKPLPTDHYREFIAEHHA